MKKFYLLLLILLIYVFVYLSLKISVLMDIIYFYAPFYCLSNQSFSFSFDSLSSTFFFMVSMVTLLVMKFSEYYMDSYNYFKFLTLTLMFFISMLFLSFSNSMMVLIVGWDGLGITSVLLVMFYPNKISSFNSILTMFFNRVGDVVMILCFCLLIFEPSVSVYCILGEDSFFLFSLLFFICAMTKSAQFPLSSWLPAAMSAPTPISAMVHSSTLVTAGVFLLMKMEFFLSVSSVTDYMLAFSSLTFLLGGVMAFFESDLKKIIAFSTMSQISMILVFISTSAIFIASYHMVLHAFFKSLIFCCAGSVFVQYFSEQKNKFISSINIWAKSSFMICGYSMTGLVFSSSFYSKDKYLEDFYSLSSLNYIFFVFIIGSIMTILYSSKILSLLTFSVSNFMMNVSKLFFGSFFMFFCTLTLLSGILISPFMSGESFICLFKLDTLLIISLLVLPLLNKIKSNHTFMILSTLDIFYMKYMTFSSFTNISGLSAVKMNLVSEHGSMKPGIMLEPLENFYNPYLMYSILLVMLMIL